MFGFTPGPGMVSVDGAGARRHVDKRESSGVGNSTGEDLANFGLYVRDNSTNHQPHRIYKRSNMQFIFLMCHKPRQAAYEQFIFY